MDLVQRVIKDIHYFVARDRDAYFKIGAVGDLQAIKEYIKGNFQDSEFLESVFATATSGRKVAKNVEFIYCKNVPSKKACKTEFHG